MDYTVLFIWIIMFSSTRDVHSWERSKRQASDAVDTNNIQSSAIVLSESERERIASANKALGVSNPTPDYFHKDWFPPLNVTCEKGKLELGKNPNCRSGDVYQEKRGCDNEAYKDDARDESGKLCETSGRYLKCNETKVCNDWTQWTKWTPCCGNVTCFYGVTMKEGFLARKRERDCRKDIGKSCRIQVDYKECASGRGAGIKHDEDITTDDDNPGSSGPIRIIAFTLAGTVMVGLLLFAVLRLRKATALRRGMASRVIEMQGFDNETGPSSPDSRIQTILNTINSNGRNYELRERSDSIPGRRVYVLSPTPETGHVTGRGRGLSRMASQLSSIAEEDMEDALSHVTETTEPAHHDDDCVFKYDSDAINEVQSLHSLRSGSRVALDEARNGDISSSEALNCINDVIAMYDVDNDENMKELLKRHSVVSEGDFRTSGDHDNENFLQDFGWKPEERTWKLERLKDGNSKENMSASCSTLDSKFSERSIVASSSSLRHNDSREPLLGDSDMTSSNFMKSASFKSLPAVLDTSLIPDIEEILEKDVVTSEEDISDVINEKQEYDDVV